MMSFHAAQAPQYDSEQLRYIINIIQSEQINATHWMHKTCNKQFSWSKAEIQNPFPNTLMQQLFALSVVAIANNVRVVFRYRWRIREPQDYMIKLKRKRPQLRRYGPASKFGVKNKCPESTQNVFIKDRIMLGLVNTLSSLIPADTPLLGASLLPASTHRKSISPIRIYCCILRLDTKYRFHHH